MPRRRQMNTRPAGAPNGNGNHHEDPNYHHQHHQYQNNHQGQPHRQHRTQRHQQHHHHHHHQNVIDPAAAAEAAKASAVVAYRNDTRSSLNLPVITRHVPNAKRVVCQAAYCTVYKISATSGQWDKPDIEGPLFVLEVDIEPNSTPSVDVDGGGGSNSSEKSSDSTNNKFKKLRTKYQIFIMNRKGICSLLIPLPRKPANLDTGNSELISILIDKATVGTDGGKMKFDASDEKGKSVECYGLRIYSEEGTSTEGDRIRIGEELKALVEELKEEEELLAAREAEEAEKERLRIVEEEEMQRQQLEQQQQQQQQQQQAAQMMGRSMSTYRDMGGSYREPRLEAGRRITLAELFGHGGGGGGGGGGMAGQMGGGYPAKEFEEDPPGPVSMSYSYTHM